MVGENHDWPVRDGVGELVADERGLGVEQTLGEQVVNPACERIRRVVVPVGAGRREPGGRVR